MTPRITSFLIQLLVPAFSCSLVLAQQEMPTEQEVILQEEMALSEQSPPQQETLRQETAQLDTSQQEISHRDASTPPPPQAVPRQSRPAFTQQDLDQMLAPIALYPDSLLSQILMAATYPLEVIEAARWSKAHPNLKGEPAVQAVAEYPWDPSVKSLVAFPQILMTMDEKLNWMERLGDAFLTQEQQVMDTVQYLRQKASVAGNLSSNEHVRVEEEGQSIVIQPADPQVVYVPYYNPMEVYGPWWWPAYPPVYWGLWPGYFYGPRFGVGFAWGFGIGVGPGFFFGGFNWPFRHVTVFNVNNFYYHPRFVNRVNSWAHDPVHRRGIPYNNPALGRQFGRMSASPDAHAFRGRTMPSFEGRSGFGNHGSSHNGFSNRPDFHGNSFRSNSPGSRSGLHGFPGRPSLPSGVPPRIGSRPPAFAGSGQTPGMHHFGSGGHTSPRGFGAPHGGGFRGGGGGRHR
jgi:hypothetical protein